MKNFPGAVFCFPILFFLAACSPRTGTPSSTNVSDTNPPPRLAVELRDGSRVVGDSVEKNFKFHSTLLGDLILAVKDIRTVECLSSNSAKLSTANGDLLTVAFVDSQFAVKTSFGKVDLLVNSVRKISMSAWRSSGQVRDGLVFFWSGIGDNKDNIGTDPDTLMSLSRPGIVKIASNPDLASMQQTRQLTIALWIKPKFLPREFPVLLSKGGNSPNGAYGGYELVLNANGDNDIMFVSGKRGSSTFGANGRWINKHLGEWIHVVCTVDDRMKTQKFYVNGRPTNDEDNNGTDADINFDVPNNLYIGTPDPASHPNRTKFEGEMRDVKLFNRVLTAEEIYADFEAGHSN